jgi:tetratricopeptide (TPR) repeat protein
MADGWYNRGNVMFALGRHAEAVAHLTRALRLAPAHSKAARKLEHVRADRTLDARREFDTELQLSVVGAAADACIRAEGADHLSEDEQAECMATYELEARGRREADGPLLV